MSARPLPVPINPALLEHADQRRQHLGAMSITDHELAGGSGPTNPTLTEIVGTNSHGHALTIDGGWRDIVYTALAFVQRST